MVSYYLDAFFRRVLCTAIKIFGVGWFEGGSRERFWRSCFFNFFLLFVLFVVYFCFVINLFVPLYFIFFSFLMFMLIRMLAGKKYILRRFYPYVVIYLRIHHHIIIIIIYYIIIESLLLKLHYQTFIWETSESPLLYGILDLYTLPSFQNNSCWYQRKISST